MSRRGPAVKRECHHKTVTHQHGTYLAYNGDGCRCADCVAASNAQRRQWRRKRYRIKWSGQTQWVHPVGTQRRIAALLAIGWRLRQLADEAGTTLHAIHRLQHCDRDNRRGIHPETAQRISDLYDRLCMKPPTGIWADRARRQAAEKGWAPPLAWDDESIDDPNAEPYGIATTCSADGCAVPVLAKGLCNRHYKQQRGGGIDTTSARGLTPGRPRLDDVDELIVDAFLEGHRVALTHADALEVIRRLLQRGQLSHTQIAEHVGTSTRTVARVSSELQQEAAA